MDGLRRGGIIGGIRYAVGKVIGGRLYVHRDYAERELGEIYLSAAAAFRGRILVGTTVRCRTIRSPAGYVSRRFRVSTGRTSRRSGGW